MGKKDQISPFEFKEELVELAESNTDLMMLNAGRGNPNFLSTIPRHAFLTLGAFAVHESERSYSYLDDLFGGSPEKKDIVDRFDQFCSLHENRIGVNFLRAALAFVDDHIGASKADFLFEMVNAFLGCYYPYPPRMLSISEQVVKRYLQMELFNNAHSELEFDIFATEGGTAAMTYLFQSFALNHLLKKGDKIAMITPIFSPYLEIPELPEYELELVPIRAKESEQWQVPESELEKLADPAIKILCMVNPSNPPSVKMSNKTLHSIAEIVENKNPELMIVTDDVYATFSDDFESLFARCPYNTVCVYSFSKYFGATGWRLGVIGIHDDNVFDDKIKKLDKKAKDELNVRYSSLTKDIPGLKFIDRLVADSRAVALNHTAGLSTPAQLQMLLFSLSSMLDDEDHYRHCAKKLIRRRFEILLRAISPKLVSLVDMENVVGYYELLDLPELAKLLFDDKFGDYVLNEYNAPDFLRRLAKETGVVLLPGKGFAAEYPSARVSLANLREVDYRQIGAAIRHVLDELYKEHGKM